MEQRIEWIPLCKSLEPDQEFIVDLDGDVFNPILTLGPVIESKIGISMENSLIPDYIKIDVKQFVI